jgi:uncharacterized membrane protein YfcA
MDLPLDSLLLFAAVGFLAQLVDGAVGMAYGLTASSVLLSLGVAPATASAAIHAAEIATTGASGLAHARLGHVVRPLLWRLALPGAAGGMLGAWLLSDLPADWLRPAIALYLAAMGALILRRALRPPTAREAGRVAPLGLAGGFLDAIGGGGWGPIVTSTLIGRGVAPRIAIGTSNAAEFFVTSAITAVFAATIGLELWAPILGLVLGGVAAAPLAALVVRRLPERAILAAVGCVISALALRSLWLMLA